jgi:hypothetical protein
MVAAAVALTPGATGLMAQEATVTGSVVSLSSASASLELELADGGTRVVAFEDGSVLVDGEARGTYEPGGSLESSWRGLISDPAMFAAENVAERLAEWAPLAAGDAEAASAGALEALFDRLAGSADEPPSVAGPDGGMVAIAPGTMSLRDLTGRIEVLRRSLDRLGAQTPGVGEDIALVVHDDHVIRAGEVVEGNLALLSGELALGGEIRGDVLVLDGTLTLAPSARIEGDVLQVGGELIGSDGRVTGEIVSLLSGDLAEQINVGLESDLPVDLDLPARVHVRSASRGFVGSIGHNFGHAVGGVMGVLAWLLALGALGLAVVYFFRRRLEVVADAIRTDMVRSFGVGLAGQLLVIPILLLLVVGIITWLVIPVYALAVALSIPIGYLAVAHAVGETVSEQRYDWMERFKLGRTSSYHHVLNGLLFLLAPFAIGSVLYLFGGLMGFVRGMMFFAAGVLTWAAITTGFGAVILTRGGSRQGVAPPADLEDLFSATGPFGEEAEGEASA